MSCGKHHETPCSEVLEAVYVYLDAECDEDRRRKIVVHLDECDRCMREYGIEREVKVLVGRSCGNDVAPEYLRERLRAKLRHVVVPEVAGTTARLALGRDGAGAHRAGPGASPRLR